MFKIWTFEKPHYSCCDSYICSLRFSVSPFYRLLSLLLFGILLAAKSPVALRILHRWFTNLRSHRLQWTFHALKSSVCRVTCCLLIRRFAAHQPLSWRYYWYYKPNISCQNNVKKQALLPVLGIKPTISTNGRLIPASGIWDSVNHTQSYRCVSYQTLKVFL